MQVDPEKTKLMKDDPEKNNVTKPREDTQQCLKKKKGSYRKTRSPKKTSEMFHEIGILELEPTVIV